MSYEKNEAYLTGVWNAIVGWAKDFQKLDSSETKVEIAREIVKRVLHLVDVAERYHATIEVRLKPTDC